MAPISKKITTGTPRLVQFAMHKTCWDKRGNGQEDAIRRCPDFVYRWLNGRESTADYKRKMPATNYPIDQS
jgi:hypothetical protein